MNTNEKAPAGAIREASESNLNLTLDGKFKGFDVLNSSQNSENLQCQLCNPSARIPRGAVELCEDCTVAQVRLEAVLLAEISKPRKVIRLHRCAACQKSVTPVKFSRDWGICKSCVADVVSKSKVARSNFVERAVNNFRKMLKGVAAL